MNSRTSRPRSPTSAITLTSARAWRASMPSSVDLPPPAIAKMPTRWPSPTVSAASIARTPVGSGASMLRRCSGEGALACSGVLPTAGSSARPSSGRPNASITRPSSAGPHGTLASSARACTAAPTATPCNGPYGARITSPPANPITSASSGSAPSGSVAGSKMRHCWPIRARNPVARSTVPVAWITRPCSTTVRVDCNARSSRCVSLPAPVRSERALVTRPPSVRMFR